jgi:hypothetical protein
MVIYAILSPTRSRVVKKLVAAKPEMAGFHRALLLLACGLVVAQGALNSAERREAKRSGRYSKYLTPTNPGLPGWQSTIRGAAADALAAASAGGSAFGPGPFPSGFNSFTSASALSLADSGFGLKGGKGAVAAYPPAVGFAPAQCAGEQRRPLALCQASTVSHCCALVPPQLQPLPLAATHSPFPYRCNSLPVPRHPLLRPVIHPSDLRTSNPCLPPWLLDGRQRHVSPGPPPPACAPSHATAAKVCSPLTGPMASASTESTAHTSTLNFYKGGAANFRLTLPIPQRLLQFILPPDSP